MFSIGIVVAEQQHLHLVDFPPNIGWRVVVRIPEHPAGHSDNIRPPKPGYPATHV